MTRKKEQQKITENNNRNKNNRKKYPICIYYINSKAFIFFYPDINIHLLEFYSIYYFLIIHYDKYTLLKAHLGK